MQERQYCRAPAELLLSLCREFEYSIPWNGNGTGHYLSAQYTSHHILLRNLTLIWGTVVWQNWKKCVCYGTQNSFILLISLHAVKSCSALSRAIFSDLSELTAFSRSFEKLVVTDQVKKYPISYRTKILKSACHWTPILILPKSVVLCNILLFKLRDC